MLGNLTYRKCKAFFTIGILVWAEIFLASNSLADGLVFGGHINGPHTEMTLTKQQIESLNAGAKSIELTTEQRDMLAKKIPNASKVITLSIYPDSTECCTDDLANVAIRISSSKIEIADFLLGRDLKAEAKQNEIMLERRRDLELAQQHTHRGAKDVLLVEKAMHYVRHDDYIRGIPLLEEARKLNPDLQEARSQLFCAYNNYGVQLEKECKFKEAIDYYTKAQSVTDPKNRLEVFGIQRNIDRATGKLKSPGESKIDKPSSGRKNPSERSETHKVKVVYALQNIPAGACIEANAIGEKTVNAGEIPVGVEAQSQRKPDHPTNYYVTSKTDAVKRFSKGIRKGQLLYHIYPGFRGTTVVFALKDIPKDTTISADSIEEKDIHPSEIPIWAVDSVINAIGKPSLGIKKGQVVIWGDRSSEYGVNGRSGDYPAPNIIEVPYTCAAKFIPAGSIIKPSDVKHEVSRCWNFGRGGPLIRAASPEGRKPKQDFDVGQIIMEDALEHAAK